MLREQGTHKFLIKNLFVVLICTMVNRLGFTLNSKNLKTLTIIVTFLVKTKSVYYPFPSYYLLSHLSQKELPTCKNYSPLSPQSYAIFCTEYTLSSLPWGFQCIFQCIGTKQKQLDLSFRFFVLTDRGSFFFEKFFFFTFSFTFPLSLCLLLYSFYQCSSCPKSKH